VLNNLREKLYKTYYDEQDDNHKVFKTIFGMVLNRPKKADFEATMNLVNIKKKAKLQNKDAETKIRLVFLCQLPEIWNKIEPVFLEALRSGRFHVTILVVPTMKTNPENGIEDWDNSALSFFSTLPCEVIDAYYGVNQWVSLEELRPDYVFFQRPYDHYLPELYRSSVVSKYTKICYIPYGYLETSGMVFDICLDKNFYRYVYLFFAENPYIGKASSKRFKISHNFRLRKTLSLGYPSLDTMASLKDTAKGNNNFIDEDDKLKIVWTPRWTVDPDIGGSNFFKYKDKFVDFAKKNQNSYVLLRPHPLAFENFLNTGLMTSQELDAYKDSYKQSINASIDEEKDYLSTFWKSDVLVSDISSILVEYFMTGKPIIYCVGSSGFNKFTSQMAKSFYWANNWEDIEGILKELSQGNDPLKKKREELKQQLFGDDFGAASSKIVGAIIEDFMKA